MTIPGYRIMYDGITASLSPDDGDLYLGYIDGHWPSYYEFVRLHPGKLIVSCAVDPAHDATVLDIENGDATPEQAPGWVVRQRQRGQEPTCYMNASTWPAVRAAITAAGIAHPQYGVANYGAPDVMPTGAVFFQNVNLPGWDRSIVSLFWPGVDKPTPTPSPAPVSPDTGNHNPLGALMLDALFTVAVNGADQYWARCADTREYWALRPGDAAALAPLGFITPSQRISPEFHRELIAGSSNAGKGYLDAGGTPQPTG